MLYLHTNKYTPPKGQRPDYIVTYFVDGFGARVVGTAYISESEEHGRHIKIKLNDEIKNYLKDMYEKEGEIRQE